MNEITARLKDCLKKKRFTRRGVSTIRANLKPVEFLFAPKTVLQSFGKTRVT